MFTQSAYKNNQCISQIQSIQNVHQKVGTCTCLHGNICVDACVSTYTYIYARVHLCLEVYARARRRTCVCACARMRVYAHASVFVHF